MTSPRTASLPTPAVSSSTAATSASSVPGGSRDCSPPPAERVVVRDSAELVAAVPCLVGFPPERSLVVVSVQRRGSRSVLGVVARFDLPPATGTRKQQREGSAAAAKLLVEQAVDVLVRDRAREVVVLVYDAGPCSATPPWQRLVERLERALESAGLPVLDAFFVAEPRFRSYRCSDPECCPAIGVPVDPSASDVVGELVARGRVPTGSRAELWALVDPSDPERCAAVEAAGRQALSDIGRYWAEDRKQPWRSWQLESLQLLADVARRYLRGTPTLGHDEAGRVLAGLCDVAVRDAAAVLFTRWAQEWDGRDEADDDAVIDDVDAGGVVGNDAGDRCERGRVLEQGEVTRGDSRMVQLLDALRGEQDDAVAGVTAVERDRRLETMWLELAVCCDGPLATAPLVLFGMHVWSQGNGTLAAAAVERALTIDPGYRLALLLERALAIGMRPRALDERVSKCGNA